MSLVDYIDKKGEIRKGELKSKASKKQNSSFRFYDIFGMMIMPILIGVIGGSYLDRVFHKTPFFILMGLGLGIITVIYNLYQLFKQ